MIFVVDIELGNFDLLLEICHFPNFVSPKFLVSRWHLCFIWFNILFHFIFILFKVRRTRLTVRFLKYFDWLEIKREAFCILNRYLNPRSLKEKWVAHCWHYPRVHFQGYIENMKTCGILWSARRAFTNTEWLHSVDLVLDIPEGARTFDQMSQW